MVFREPYPEVTFSDDDNYNVRAKILATKEGTVVELNILGNKFVGVAKTHPLDMPGDVVVGKWLAMARALKKARKHFRELAYEGIAEHEKTLESQTEARKAMLKPPSTLPEWEDVRERGWLKNFKSDER